jgi:F420-dependent oxidoreductase-like protein
MLEPQEGLSYADILAVAQRAERLGFAGLYRSDHYSTVTGSGQTAPSTDAWATLAGLARDTSRIALGTMVSPVTFRRAGNLAKVVATVAEMAGTVGGAARIHLGLGTGWLETEHRQHGFPFEDVVTRFRRLDEQLQILRGLWDPDAEAFDFDGEFEQLQAAHFCPKPDPRPRIVVGGSGLRKTPRLAARYADELNTPFKSPEECSALRAALDEACEAEGRNPSTVSFSLMTGCVVGRDEAEVRRRAQRLYERSDRDGSFDEWFDGFAGRGVLGTPEQAADKLGRLGEAGIQAVMLQHLLYDDLDMLDVVAEDIAPRL